MLKAIVNGKAGRIDAHKGESVSWSRLFKRHEDLLTATFFERFSYLSDAVQLSLLSHWFAEHSGTLQHQFLGFKTIDYWVRFELGEQGNYKQVEPDLIMRFNDFNIMVEVKPPDGGDQSDEQWANEIASFIQDPNNDSKPLYFLAIGGSNPKLAKAWSSQLLQRFAPQLTAIAALNWQPVAKQLLDLANGSVDIALNRQDTQVLKDMLEGLNLYGLGLSPFTWKQLLSDTQLPNLSLETFKSQLPLKD